ncbi:hypothetical protein Pse7367_3272 [Thalassoporum mexicanum PCC 7367]|uniref:hypothetical protein n=1 Tax=Thalassoporum mexicanum TaxID=3457544 RepID=UPI00029FE8AE|nr:hypothetical protein [Pseudanabaena sp. PCC 7367]AFY71513.1 hypothetical protein Pse7367_3272 [Pseudanabaena sp. PCC 7367]
MKALIENDVIFIDRQDVPQFKKGGSVVRNNYFWAMRSIAGQAYRDRDWEYESEVWLALRRMLLSFAESGYLSTSETQLEFPVDQDQIPQILKVVSTRQSPEPIEALDSSFNDYR